MSITTFIDRVTPVRQTAFDQSFKTLAGKPFDLAQFEGKTLLIVNIASLCRLTPQFEGLQKLHEDYKDRGLVVIGVPSNNFGNQEPKSNAEVGDFCDARFGVTFPLVQKENVIGLRAHPFYRWAFSQWGFLAVPTWNFHKIIIKPNGRIGRSIPAVINPNTKWVRRAIERLLPKAV